MNDWYRLNGTLIRKWMDREYRKLTYLVDKLGVCRSTVEAMLRGQCPRKRETVEKLASLMGCTVEELLIPVEKRVA